MAGALSGGGLAEVARLFLRLGVIGFGGPAAHIALMEEEVGRRAGPWGQVVAGLCFILPAALIVLVCAWAGPRSARRCSRRSQWPRRSSPQPGPTSSWCCWARAP